MRKWGMVIFALLLASFSVLAGCSSSDGTNLATTDDKTGNKPIEIDFWYSLGGDNGKIIEGMVKDFNESQNEIVVKPTFQGDYYENHTKVLAAVAAGNQPDITMIEIASVGAFADAKVLEDLGPLADGFEDKYIPGLMGNSYWNDKLYAVPFNRSTPIMYFNRDMLKEANLDPSGPKNWDELVEYAQALTKKDGGKTSTYGFSLPIDIWFYEALVFQSGGQILSDDGKKLTLNNEQGKAPLELWTRMIEEGVMKAPPGEKYNAWEVARQDFINGNIAMTFLTTGWLKSLKEASKFDVGAGFLPANKDYGVPTGGTNLAILSKSSDAEKKAAWVFAKWMTDTPQTIHWSLSSGYMPATSEAADSPEMQKLYKEDPNFEVAINQLEYANPRPMVPGYKELQEVIMTELQRVVLGNASIDEAMESATEKSERVLKQ